MRTAGDAVTVDSRSNVVLLAEGADSNCGSNTCLRTAWDSPAGDGSGKSYSTEEVSLWLGDHPFFVHPHKDSEESIYEVIRCPEDTESDFDEEEVYDDYYEDHHPRSKAPNGLTRFAEAAGKRMKKLKRTWSLKKSDLSRNLRKYGAPVVTRPSTTTSSTSSVVGNHRRASPPDVDAKSVVRHHVAKGKSESAATFYITLTIEHEEEDPYKSTSFSSASFDSMSSMSTNASGGGRKPLLRGKSVSQVVRPKDAPPAPPRLKSKSLDEPGPPPPLPKSSPPPLSSEAFSFQITDSDRSASPSDGENYTSLFQAEPLYQFYDGDEKAAEGMYEMIDPPKEEEEEDDVVVVEEPPKVMARPSAMDLTSVGGRHSLWTELPEVVQSGVLDSISPEGRRLQEALFEVISSEASYLKSLNVLVRHFMQSPKLVGPGAVISKRDHRVLFSDVISVRQCSEKFLEDLEKRWQSSVLLEGLCQVVRAHARENFHVYIKYCSNQVYQDRIMTKLRGDNPRFVEALQQLESSPVCQLLAMHSFLMLPMQRITRMPLLVNSIFKRLDGGSPEHEPCKEALDTINKIVQECDESARDMERMEEMLILSQQMDFKELKALPLISASRWLVRRGEATRIWWRENSDAKLTFGRKVNKQNYVLLLFTDLLAITKRKSDDHYVVVDYCPRSFVQLQEVDSSDAAIPCSKSLGDQGNVHLAWLTLLQSQESKTVEWLMSFPSESERRSWCLDTMPLDQSSAKPGEKIYQDWDCPEMEAVQTYNPASNDELELREGECVKVIRKMTDSGWYFVEKQGEAGQRKRGWIPMTVTKEIVESDHNRAKNYRKRHEFLKYLSSMDDEATKT